MTKPMTCDELALMLADYLEGDADEATRERVEMHARTCTECASLLDDLRHLRVAAAALPELTPSRDLWSGISARIETPVVELNNAHRAPVASERRMRWARMGVAAAVLVAATATITQQITTRSIANTATQRTAAGRPSAEGALVSNPVPGAAQYDREIAQLRAVLNARRPQLDSATVAVVERNLAVIDEAIAQCTQALRRDPGSKYLMESLHEEMDTKVQLLRTAAALPSRS